MADNWYFASCARGLEPLLANEVSNCGGHSLRIDPGGVSFKGTFGAARALCLWSRVAGRVFEEIERGRIQHVDGIYGVAQRVRWDRYLGPEQTFAITSKVSGPVARDSRYTTLKLKDAIVDQFRDARGSRPNVDTEDPDLSLRVTVKGTVVTLSRDLAGAPLHKRGYRQGAQHKSPLNEALAAGLLLLSGWDRTTSLCDPMCGSGTFLVEAAMIAADRAPGLQRNFAFERWIDHDAADWGVDLAHAETRWRAGRNHVPPLYGNDHHPGALGLAHQAISRAGLGTRITLHQGELATYVPPTVPAFVVSNPPYAERLQEQEDAENTWWALGTWLREQAPGSTAWLLSGNPELTRKLRMKTSQKIPVKNGGIDTRFLRYDVRGSH